MMIWCLFFSLFSSSHVFMIGVFVVGAMIVAIDGVMIPFK